MELGSWIQLMLFKEHCFFVTFPKKYFCLGLTNLLVKQILTCGSCKRLEALEVWTWQQLCKNSGTLLWLWNQLKKRMILIG